MRRTRRHLSMAVTALGATLWSPLPLHAQERPGDREAIRALRAKDARAVETGDLDALLTITTDDVVLMPPGGDFVRGAARRAEGLRSALSAYEGDARIQYRFDFEELEIVGDRAIEWGVLRYSSTSPDGTSQAARFKLLRILKRLESGEWRVHRAIWNAWPEED